MVKKHTILAKILLCVEEIKKVEKGQDIPNVKPSKKHHRKKNHYGMCHKVGHKIHKFSNNNQEIQDLEETSNHIMCN